MVKITEIVESSVEWTVTVLFRPFKPKKWLLLGFIALLAGQLAQGGNFNSAYQDDRRQEASQTQQSRKISGTQGTLNHAHAGHSAKTSQEQFAALMHAARRPMGIAIITLVIMVIVLFFIIMTWLSARFNFVFLEDVVKNDASVKIPFKNNRILGDSLFKFSLFLGIIFLILLALIIFACFHALSSIGALSAPASVGVVKIFVTCIPFVLIFCLLLLLSGLLSFIVNDFALIIMYKDKIAVIAAIKEALTLIRHNMRDILKYLLIKIALFICASLMYAALTLVLLFGLLYPGIIAAVLGYTFSRLLPHALHLVYFVLVTIIAVSIFLFLVYCAMCLYLPFAVFFRTLSVKFMGRLHEHYNLFLYDKE